MVVVVRTKSHFPVYFSMVNLMGLERELKQTAKHDTFPLFQ